MVSVPGLHTNCIAIIFENVICEEISQKYINGHYQRPEMLETEAKKRKYCIRQNKLSIHTILEESPFELGWRFIWLLSEKLTWRFSYCICNAYWSSIYKCRAAVFRTVTKETLNYCCSKSATCCQRANLRFHSVHLHFMLCSFLKLISYYSDFAELV